MVNISTKWVWCRREVTRIFHLEAIFRTKPKYFGEFCTEFHFFKNKDIYLFYQIKYFKRQHITDK